jgi:hypothetical protein
MDAGDFTNQKITIIADELGQAVIPLFLEWGFVLIAQEVY